MFINAIQPSADQTTPLQAVLRSAVDPAFILSSNLSSNLSMRLMPYPQGLAAGAFRSTPV